MTGETTELGNAADCSEAAKQKQLMQTVNNVEIIKVRVHTFAEMPTLSCSKMHGIQNDHLSSGLTSELSDGGINNIVAPFDRTIQSKAGFYRRTRPRRVRCTMLSLRV